MHPFIAHLKASGATIAGQHYEAEIRATEAQLALRIPGDFRTYFASFRSCMLPESNWEFFDIPACIERTLEYRAHYSRIHGTGFDTPIASAFAFCDHLIDAPSYFVVAEPTSPLFGFIIGTHSENGWIAGKNLAEFLIAFQRDWDGGIVMYEE